MIFVKCDKKKKQLETLFIYSSTKKEEKKIQFF